MMVVLSFVYICNARCPNCPYNNSEIRSDYKDALIMPPQIFTRIADECGPYGTILRLSGGGEPMLHPQAVRKRAPRQGKGRPHRLDYQRFLGCRQEDLTDSHHGRDRCH